MPFLRPFASTRNLDTSIDAARKEARTLKLTHRHSNVVPPAVVPASFENERIAKAVSHIAETGLATRSRDSRFERQKGFFLLVEKGAFVRCVARYVRPKRHFSFGVVVFRPSVRFLATQARQFVTVGRRSSLAPSWRSSTRLEVTREKFAMEFVDHVLLVESMMEMDVDGGDREGDEEEDEKEAIGFEFGGAVGRAGVILLGGRRRL